jgi:hypothetical protein
MAMEFHLVSTMCRDYSGTSTAITDKCLYIISDLMHVPKNEESETVIPVYQNEKLLTHKLKDQLANFFIY